MKVAILTDTHWSARKASSIFTIILNLFIRMFSSLPLEEHGVETVIHMGDAFDNRKSIDFWGLIGLKELY
jgi:predicted phosphodiesterase